MSNASPRDNLADRLFDLFQDGVPGRSTQADNGRLVGSLKGLREDNQDRAASAFIQFADSEAVMLGVVCDGMGGMQEGGAAAATALSTFIAEFATSRGHMPNRLERALFAANDAIFRDLRGRGGSTLTALAVSTRGETWSAHAGDSRLYEVTELRELKLRSQDDTIHGVVHQVEDSINEDNLDNRLLQFVGMGSDFLPHISGHPPIRGGTWLITTDGIHGVGRKTMENVIKHSSSAMEAARKLIFLVDASPLGDNGSVVAITPSAIVLPKPLRGGIGIGVLTPSNRLDLWLSGYQSADREMAIAPRHETTPESAAEIAPAVKPKSPVAAGSKTSKRKSTKATTSKAPKSDPAGKTAPILRVLFGDPESQRDD